MKYTLQYFERVAFETPKFIINSLLYSGISVVICIAVGVPRGLGDVPDQTAGPGVPRFADHADPGPAGDRHRHRLHARLPGPAAVLWTRPSSACGSSSRSCSAVRRLPYTVRGTFASLLIVHRSFEEAAESVGATKMTTFKDVTLPLIWKGVLVGSLYSFILALQEASATLLLVVPGHEMMTVGIFNFYIGGSVNEAAALGFILIVLGAACLFIINRMAGLQDGRRLRLKIMPGA